KTYSQSLIENLSKSMNDQETEFTGIPLQTRMVAEIFESGTDNETGLRGYLLCESDSKILVQSNQVGLVDLYEKFIQKKFDVSSEEKEKKNTSNVSAKQRLEQECKSFK